MGDLVLAHLRKERIPKGKYTKLQMKKIGPCRFVHKFGVNAYEIELPPRVAIYPIFNVSNLYPFKGSMFVGEDVGTPGVQDEDWVKDLPPSHPLKLEGILDTKEAKKAKRTRHKVYNEYIVKWKGLPHENSTWIT